MELVIVPWTPGPLLRVERDGPGSAGDLRRRTGLPIDLSDPDVGALVDAYEAVLATVPPTGPSVTAAHFALLETASLLRWAPPAGPAEREYVRRHARAIADLVARPPADALAYLRAELDRI
ncbi:MAG TPA: hypothetical protein VFS16_02040 [Acidimicrobiia bacterium]|nr:hypothetical protein [Acidimicrobiia bacterium]